MPRPRKSSKPNKKKQYNKKSQYNKNRKKQYRTSNQIISRPLLPETQKVMMRYSTRIQITPSIIHSGALETSSNVSTHTFHWNNLFDPDYTTSAVASMTEKNDGAWDHQPRMYDQYSAFYNRLTCIGSKAKICFSQNNRAITTLGNNPDGAVSYGMITDPKPMYVGFCNANYYRDAVVLEKFDSLNEKKEIRYKRLLTQDKPQYFTAKWSINKEPSRYRNLVMNDGETNGDWGHDFGANGPHTQNTRYLHLFAHPISINESTPDQNTPQPPIDVQVDIEYICILSDRKEVVQS